MLIKIPLSAGVLSFTVNEWKTLIKAVLFDFWDTLILVKAEKSEGLSV